MDRTELIDVTPDAVTIPAPELHEAIVHDDASEAGELVRCTVPAINPVAATDPMPWQPYVTARGTFYPKSGDRAVLAYQPDGTPVIVFWKPSASEPDAAGGSFSQTIGNGSSKVFVLEHNLGTRSIVPSVFQAGTPWEQVLGDWVGFTVAATTTNKVTITFETAPTTNQYTVTIAA